MHDMGSIIELPKQGLAGEYKLVARKANGSGERLLADWFSNNITEVGLDNLITDGWKAYCHVGTGTVAPTDTDTALLTPVASTGAITNINASSLGSTPYYSQSSVDYVFPVGAGTFTEVGVASGPHDGAYVLFSRALIVDGAGSPTAITTLADEYLVVTYRLRIYPNLTDETGNIGVGSDVHAYTIRASDVNLSSFWTDSLNGGGSRFHFSANNNSLRVQCFSGGIGAVIGSPTGLLSTFRVPNENAYVPGSRQFLADAGFGFNENNEAGQIGALRFHIYKPSGTDRGWGSYQIGFNPPITKDAGIALTFTVGMGWGRYVAP